MVIVDAMVRMRDFVMNRAGLKTVRLREKIEFMQ